MEPNSLLYFLKKSTEFLEKKGIPNPRVDAEWILSDLLGLSRIQLYSKFDMPLDEKEITAYRERIVERGKRKPVAYITGKKGFHSFEFLVSPSVLIPRPETEELVDYLAKKFSSQKIQIWDLCCGSGNIGVSLAKLLPESDVVLSDISQEAMEVTKQNAKALDVFDRCEFWVSDLDQNIPQDKQFSLIVANPPYIPLSEKDNLMDDVLLYEPHLALFVEDIYSFHETIFSVIQKRLIPGGYFCLESHPEYIHTLLDLAKEKGLSELGIKIDTSGKNRFLYGIR